MKDQTTNPKNPSDSRKAAAAHALTHYFTNMADEFTSTPPLSRIPVEKLRADILKRLLIETYQTVQLILPDKRAYNAVFRSTFKPLVKRVWADFPRI